MCSVTSLAVALDHSTPLHALWALPAPASYSSLLRPVTNTFYWEQNTAGSACDSDVSAPAHSFLPLPSVLAATVVPVTGDALTKKQSSVTCSHRSVFAHLAEVPVALGDVSGAGSSHGVQSHRTRVISVKVTSVI